MKRGLSVFQMLKTGTSFKQKQESNRFQKKDNSLSRQQTPQRKLSDSSIVYKYNESDSDDSINENLKKLSVQLQNSKSRRKMSVDELEKDWEHQQQLKKQKVNVLMKKYKVKVEGDNVPPLLTNFTKMKKFYNFDQKILDNMKKAGYQKPTPVQMQAIPIIMEKRSLMALAPTGSGKTAAYGLPIIKILEKHEKTGIRVLIFAPTNELGEQIQRELEFLIYGIKDSVRIKFLSKINTEINAFKKEIEHIDILICTPLKFLKITKRAQEKFEHLQFLIFDEADRYFEFNLVKQMKKILEHFQNHSKVNYLLFSATIQHPVQELVKQLIHEPIKLTVGGTNNVLQSVEQKLHYCQSELGKLLEIKNLINSGQFTPPVLIFVQSKDRGEQLQETIKNSCLNTNIKIERIDSDKSKQEREQIIEQFRLGNIWVLICTDLMARGIDFKGVNLVINYDFPTTIINYIHRVGRTGRAGRTGKAITLYTNQDKPLLRSLGNMLKSSGCEVPDWIFSLQKANKKTLKHIEKFPLKRENISLDPEKQKQDDEEFDKQIRIADGQYYSIKKKQKKNENKETNNNDDWQIA